MASLCAARQAGMRGAVRPLAPLLAAALLLGCTVAGPANRAEGIAALKGVEPRMAQFLGAMETLCLKDQNAEDRDLALRVAGFQRVDTVGGASAQQPWNAVGRALRDLGVAPQPVIRPAGFYRKIFNKTEPRRNIFGGYQVAPGQRTTMSISDRDGLCGGVIQDVDFTSAGHAASVAFGFEQLGRVAGPLATPAVVTTENARVARFGARQARVAISYFPGERFRSGNQITIRNPGLLVSLVPLN